ncbi:MAG: sugar transferase, partial [Actinobacteria bacterium]|nr:sugar transferase [Actinomycetota bacterium]
MQASRYIAFKTRFGRVIAAILAAILILLISPILLITALLVKCTSRGPVLYVADRLGRDGRVFRMYKFRSMKVNAPETVAADGKVVVSKRDPRFTSIAPILRMGFDELPQLFNVLKGEMLFIGPRPDVTRMIDVYTPEQTPRLLAVPGLTGLTQVLDGRHLTNEHN